MLAHRILENGQTGLNGHRAHHTLNGGNSHNDHNNHAYVQAAIGCPFKIRSADYKLQPAPADASQQHTFEVTTPAASPDATSSTAAEAPLGPLTAFVGKFQGLGFNTIFRPNSGPPVPQADRTIFPTAITPPPPQNPNEQTLELNLTTETLTFAPSLQQVPNRGLINQGDIVLNGIPYEQRVSDVTNSATGKGDGPPQPIHFENGLFMHVPASSTPDVGAYVTFHHIRIKASGLSGVAAFTQLKLILAAPFAAWAPFLTGPPSMRSVWCPRPRSLGHPPSHPSASSHSLSRPSRARNRRASRLPTLG